ILVNEINAIAVRQLVVEYDAVERLAVGDIQAFIDVGRLMQAEGPAAAVEDSAIQLPVLRTVFDNQDVKGRRWLRMKIRRHAKKLACNNDTSPLILARSPKILMPL